MNLPHSYDELCREELRDFYLGEFKRRLHDFVHRSIFRSRQLDSSDTRIAQNIYTSVIKAIPPLPSPRIDGWPGITLEQVEAILDKNSGDESFSFQGSLITGDAIAGLIALRTVMDVRQTFIECLSLKNGWHRQLLSLYLKGEVVLGPSNFHMLSERIDSWAPQLTGILYKLELNPDGTTTSHTYSLEHVARLYLLSIRSYASMYGGRASHILRAHELFDRPYDTKYRTGAADIFDLAISIYYRSEVEVECRKQRLNTKTYLKVVALKYDIKPTNVDEEEVSRSLAVAARPSPDAPRKAPDGQPYN